MELIEHFRAIWRRRLMIVALSLLVAGLVYAWSASKPEVYRATANVRVTPGPAQSGQILGRDSIVVLTERYAELGKGDSAAEAAAADADLDLSPSQVRARTTISAPDPGRIAVESEGRSGADAADLANGVARAIVAAATETQQQDLFAQVEQIRRQIEEIDDVIEQLQTDQIGSVNELQALRQALLARISQDQLREADEIELLAEAVPPANPVSPKPNRDAFIALLAALVINAELAVLLEIVGDRFSTVGRSEETLRSLGLQVLARIPTRRRGLAKFLQGRSPTVAYSRSGGATQDGVIEAIRDLRTSLQFLGETERRRRLAFVSVERGAGKTFVSCNLAESFDGLGVPIALVDADLRRPTVHEEMALPVAPGLTEALAGRPPEDVLNRVGSDLRVMTAGSAVPDPAAALGSPALQKILDSLIWAEFVVIDTPPIDLFADASSVARHCDGAVLVVNARRTRRGDVATAVERLNQVGAEVVGVVLNRAKIQRDPTKYYERKRPRGGRSMNGSGRRGEVGSTTASV